MAKILTFEIPENEYIEFSEFLSMASAEMKKSREIMNADQIEINQLRTDIEKIRQDTYEIKKKSDVVLNDLIKKHLKAA
jgi:hypothetical protein